MISKAKIKEIKALEMKKNRDERGLFVAEGVKTVGEMLSIFECDLLVGRNQMPVRLEFQKAAECIFADDIDMKKISSFKSPSEVVAVLRKPSYRLEDVNPSVSLVLVLDGVQDPGNVGAIIRTADWFGVGDVVCSLDTADAFAPKTVQAAMGSLARVRVHYTDIETWLAQQSDVPVYGAFLNGENIYDKQLSANGIIVMGNEGRGIRKETAALVNSRLRIPSYPAGRHTAESLNVAMATAVVCAEFRRRERSMGFQPA